MLHILQIHLAKKLLCSTTNYSAANLQYNLLFHSLMDAILLLYNLPWKSSQCWDILPRLDDRFHLKQPPLVLSSNMILCINISLDINMIQVAHLIGLQCSTTYLKYESKKHNFSDMKIVVFWDGIPCSWYWLIF